MVDIVTNKYKNELGIINRSARFGAWCQPIDCNVQGLIYYVSVIMYDPQEIKFDPQSSIFYSWCSAVIYTKCNEVQHKPKQIKFSIQNPDLWLHQMKSVILANLVGNFEDESLICWTCVMNFQKWWACLWHEASVGLLSNLLNACSYAKYEWECT